MVEPGGPLKSPSTSTAPRSEIHMRPLLLPYIVEKAIPPSGSVRLAGSVAGMITCSGPRGVEVEDRGWVWCGGCSHRRGRAAPGELASGSTVARRWELKIEYLDDESMLFSRTLDR